MFSPMHRRPQRPNHQFQKPQHRSYEHGSQGVKLERFSTSLDTVQQVLGIVGSTAPYIEKYGPIVQKIPTMYRMYKAIKSADQVEVPKNAQVQAAKNHSVPKSRPINRQQNHDYPEPTLYI